jgi:hypothetical protein
VNEKNVIDFYRNALPGSSNSDFYKKMQEECLIWHPDKRLIWKLTLTDEEYASMAVIARKVIELRKEFREGRAS